MQTRDPLYSHRGLKLLLISGKLVYAPHDVHALYNLAKGRKALTVGITLSCEIEFGLVSDADKEVMGGRVRSHARHGNGTVQMFQAGVTGPFKLDRRK